MIYKEDFKIGEVLQSLYGLGAQICNNVYTGNRPQATPEQMKEFIVVSVPSRLDSSTYGGGYGTTKTYCNIEIFVKLKKSGHEDLNKLDNLLGNLINKLPYSSEIIQITNPQIMLRGNDGLGFSAVLVRAELLIK
jgi:hypothetical protein